MEQSELQRTARLVEMNRERFHEVQERIEQVINVLGEHDVTATILETLATKDHESEMKMHVSIGAGVTLPANTLVAEKEPPLSIWKRYFGERTWSDAASLTRERMEELGTLLESLQSQSQQLESTIATLAQPLLQLQKHRLNPNHPRCERNRIYSQKQQSTSIEAKATQRRYVWQRTNLG